MRIVQTADLTPTSLPTETEKLWVYNGLDCCVTAEVLDALLPQLDEITEATYDFSLALQGPALGMRLRGVLVDAERKSRVISLFMEQISDLESSLEQIAAEGLGIFGFNWRSNRDLQTLFYERLKIPVIRKAGVPTVNREALEKMEAYFIARPIIDHLILLRELGKKIGVLKTEIDPDGRMRTSYNIAGTTTGRFSSSYSEYGTGTNLQNIEETVRSIFCADPGMKMAYLDEPQGESRVVGAIEWNLFHDGRYLDVCESGDLHTNVAKLCWPDLGWTGNAKDDRALAERPFYRHYDYRFMCKKIGHGTNYGGKPYTLSRQAKIDSGPIEEFQPKYFTAFPAHLRWQEWVRNQLQTRGCLTSLTGRRRWFFGRRDADDTYREALAFDPQGSLADILNRGMLAVWRQSVAAEKRYQELRASLKAGYLPGVELLMQIHDAILIQYPEEQEDEILPKVLSKLTQSVQLKHDRVLTLVPDIKVGWNWGNYCCGDKSRKACASCRGAANLDGLKSYVSGDKRKRTPKTSILDRIIP